MHTILEKYLNKNFKKNQGIQNYEIEEFPRKSRNFKKIAN